MANRSFAAVVRHGLADRLDPEPILRYSKGRQGHPLTSRHREPNSQHSDHAAAKTPRRRTAAQERDRMVPQEAAGDCVVIPASALNMDSLWSEVAFFRRHMAIIKFTTTLLPETCHTDWIRELEDKMGGRI
jgi:hypothetical protein